MTDVDNLDDYGILLINQMIERLEAMKNIPIEERTSLLELQSYNDTMFLNVISDLEEYTEKDVDLLISKFKDALVKNEFENKNTGFFNVDKKGEA